MSKGVDLSCCHLTLAQARAIKAAGYDFVGKYLVPEIYGNKSLTAQEARNIQAAGLRVLCVWETSAGRAAKGAEAGVNDGTIARLQAQRIGMPEDGVIYFAVDYDAPTSDFGIIATYLRYAAKQIKPYKIGVYGSYKVVEEMHKRGVCDCFWQCVAWSGGKKSAHRHIYQSQWDKKVAGLTVDINECEDMDKAGIWPVSKADLSTAAQTDANEKNGGEILNTGESDDMDMEKFLAALTDEQAYTILEKAQRHAAKLPLPGWAVDEFADAVEHKITDGTAPMQLIPRYQAALMGERARQAR